MFAHSKSASKTTTFYSFYIFRYSSLPKLYSLYFLALLIPNLLPNLLGFNLSVDDPNLATFIPPPLLLLVLCFEPSRFDG